MSDQTQAIHHKKSKLEQFNLSFEYNRTLSDERRMVKHRTESTKR